MVHRQRKGAFALGREKHRSDGGVKSRHGRVRRCARILQKKRETVFAQLENDEREAMTERERLEKMIFYLRSAEGSFLHASDTGSFDEIRELIADLERKKQNLKERKEP
jgi:hypothetical protein